MTTVSIRLPDEVARRLERLARRTGRSKSFYVLEAVLEHLGDIEDVFIAEQRLMDLRAGKSETVPLEDVMREYGLEPEA